MWKFKFLALPALMLVLCAVLLAQAGAADPAGIWQGSLSVSGSELGLIFHIERAADGTYAGKLDVPAQGAAGIPIGAITIDGDRVRMELKAIGAVFEGRFNGGDEIDGAWKQSGVSLPLVLHRLEQAPVLRRPQEPVRPYPYKEEEVAYENQSAGITLAGTLTIPEGAGPFPAAVLISGSGAQDRDESLMGHRPFLVLADYLTRRGIAVLRVDDRGVGGSTGDSAAATSADFAGDVLAGVAYLKGRAEIDPGRIGLIGHSEGGIIAPMAAVRSRDVSWIVLLAGPGLPGEEIVYLQTELILRANGASKEQIARERELQEKLFAVLKSEQDDAAAAKRLRELFLGYIDSLVPEERQVLGNIDAFVSAQVQAFLSPWYRYFISYDPRPVLRLVSCPVLALNGEKDLQVPYKENLAAIEEALRTGRCKDYTIKSLPDLNHLFQTCQTGSPNEYGMIEETFAPAALEAVRDWIEEHS